jgi:RNA polymerase sigma-70 factor (ECF subfamily)
MPRSAGLRAARKIFLYCRSGTWCISCVIAGEDNRAKARVRRIEQQAIPMPTGRQGRDGRLRLVGSPTPAEGREPTAGDARLPNGRLDWSRLMVRAQDGDRQAYRLLLEDVTPYLRALALRCFKDASDIEDAVQDILLTVHLVRRTYDPGRPFGPWLVAIANRRIIDRLRRQTRAKFREIALGSAHETFSPASTNLRQDFDDRPARAAELQTAIENLPPDQRQAIKLLKLQEMSLREAASATGRSVAALKVATHRAIKRLRKMLEPPGDLP